MKVSMWSVTTETRPSRIARKRSASGTRHRRWSHGLYGGVKCFESYSLAELVAHASRHHPLENFGPLSREVVEERSGKHVLPARQHVCGAVRQTSAEPVRDLVLCGTRDDVARRALEHRDVRRALGHRGDERDGRRATADDDDALACVVEILGPLLRVHDRSAEARDAGPLRRVAALVVVVAGAEIEEVAGELDHRFVWPGLGLHGPARVVRRP